MRVFAYFVIAILLYSNLLAQERSFVIKRREAKDHIALIIGNSSYPNAQLTNPVNDATDVAEAFINMGFIVEKVIDADKEQMAQAIARFNQKLYAARAAVFYYTGHGMQVNGENYLIPIGRTPATEITDESQVPYRAINAGEVLTAMEQAKVNFALVVLDACRNNPFKGSERGRLPGLASINAPVGSLVMYATKAGSTAADGLNTHNSPFTSAFLKHITTPGLDVNLLPSKITKTVVDLTNGMQVPGTYMQLKSSFTFVPEVTPGEEKSLKTAQLTNLKTLDAEMTRKEAEIAQKKKDDDALLAKKQKEIDDLNRQIADLKNKTTAGNSGTADADLDQMLQYVNQKESQKKELEDLHKQLEERRIAREKEIYNIKIKEYYNKNSKIDIDIEKYKQIAGSEFGKEIAQTAWDNILTKYGLAKGSIEQGNEFSLKSKINPDPKLLGLFENFVKIPCGSFIIGKNKRANIEKEHIVRVDDFIIMSTEVTFDQYDVYCEETGKKKPDDNEWGRGNNPVINISWNDANNYALWLSQKLGKKWRLPTEAEWEYAALGGQSSEYSGSYNIDEVAWYVGNSDGKTHPVGKKRPNGYGLYDMTGNVWEWCSDWYSDSYNKCPSSNPQGPSTGTSRVDRGGGCLSSSKECSVYNRDSSFPAFYSNYIGFRLVCTP